MKFISLVVIHMKNHIPLFGIFLLLLLSCGKKDHQDKVVGIYSGIRVYSYMQPDSSGTWVTLKDTSTAQGFISKSGEGFSKEIKLDLQGVESTKFDYHPNQRMNIGNGLSVYITPDSLYIFHNPTRFPAYDEYFLKREN